jgi:hypothetical protein
LPDVPVRTWGRWSKPTATDGGVFVYRPWFILPERRVELPAKSRSIGRGLFYSTVRDGERSAFVLPPRYRGHEEQLAQFYGLSGVEDAGLRKAWSWLKEACGGAPKTATA